MLTTMIEQNVLGHFSYLPKVANYQVICQKNLILVNCGLGSSMFNIAFGQLFSDGTQNADQDISNLIQAFNGQPFALWIPPSEKDTNTKQLLLNHGFTVEAQEYAMIYDINENQVELKPIDDFTIKQVCEQQKLNEFVQVLSLYDKSAKKFYESFTLEELQQKEKLYIGYKNNIPACIAILYQEHDVAGIFSLITIDSMRSQGPGTSMMRHLMLEAKIARPRPNL